MDETEQSAIRAANQGFYRAFESLKLDRMEAVWLNAGGIKCIHPGWEPLFGWDDIMNSWQRIFRNTSYMEFDVQDEIMFFSGDLAVVSNLEVLTSAGAGGAAQGGIRATNVYRKHDGEWLMVIHHAG